MSSEWAKEPISRDTAERFADSFFFRLPMDIREGFHEALTDEQMEWFRKTLAEFVLDVSTHNRRVTE